LESKLATLDESIGGGEAAGIGVIEGWSNGGIGGLEDWRIEALVA
jgi:hypothetical protein